MVIGGWNTSVYTSFNPLLSTSSSPSSSRTIALNTGNVLVEIPNEDGNTIGDVIPVNLGRYDVSLIEIKNPNGKTRQRCSLSTKRHMKKVHPLPPERFGCSAYGPWAHVAQP